MTHPPAFAVKVLASVLWPFALAVTAAVVAADHLARRYGGSR